MPLRKIRKTKKAPQRRAGKAPQTRMRSTLMYGPSTAYSSQSVSTAIGTSVFSPSLKNMGFKMSLGVAPAHDDAAGRTGLRLYVNTSKHYLIRSTNSAKYMFSDGTNYFEFMSMNPIEDAAASHTYSPILGVGSPAASIAKVFTRYAVRYAKVEYVPSRGYAETGTFGLLYRPDVETTIDTYAEVKNTDSYIPGAYNSPLSAVFIKSDLKRPARTLYFIDPTAVADKDRTRMGYFHGASADTQTSADLSMGDLKFTLVIDLYCMEGDPAPSYSAIHSLVNVAPKESQPRVYAQLCALMSEYIPTDELKMFPGHFGHLVEKTEVKESKEAKESKESKEYKKDSFLLVRGGRQ